MENIQNQNSMTTEAPEVNTSASTEATTTPASTTPAPVRKMLPPGYLSTGSILDTEGIMIPEYVGRYAEELARLLEPMKVTTYQRTFLTGAKAANKKKVPYGIKKNCTIDMVVQAKKLVSRKKDPAPAVLLQMITAATNTVKDAETFQALYMHLDAIYGYMLEQERKSRLTE